jgi:hypothetical protein
MQRAPLHHGDPSRQHNAQYAAAAAHHARSGSTGSLSVGRCTLCILLNHLLLV